MHDAHEQRSIFARFLQACEAFRPEAVYLSAEEIYALIPDFWLGMTPVQKEEVQAIFSHHGEIYTPSCLR